MTKETQTFIWLLIFNDGNTKEITSYSSEANALKVGIAKIHELERDGYLESEKVKGIIDSFTGEEYVSYETFTIVMYQQEVDNENDTVEIYEENK